MFARVIVVVADASTLRTRAEQSDDGRAQEVFGTSRQSCHRSKKALKKYKSIHDQTMNDPVYRSSQVRRKSRISRRRTCNIRRKTAVNPLSNSLLTPHADEGKPRTLFSTNRSGVRAHSAIYWFESHLAHSNLLVFRQTVSIAPFTQRHITCSLLRLCGQKEPERY